MQKALSFDTPSITQDFQHMDIFNFLEFWRNADGGDPTVVRDFDSSINERIVFLRFDD